MYKALKLFPLIVFLLLLMFGSKVSIADDGALGKFIIKYGVMQAATEFTDKLVENRNITMDPERRPGWCFIVHPLNEDTYSIYSVHHLPESVNQLTGDFKDLKQTDLKAGFKTKVEQSSGITPFCFDFHAGDPIGEYRIEVFINDEIQSTIKLNVIERKSKRCKRSKCQDLSARDWRTK